VGSASEFGINVVETLGSTAGDLVNKLYYRIVWKYHCIIHVSCVK